MWLFCNAFFSGCSLHDSLIFYPCCCCCSIYKISLEDPQTACNLNFYFWWLTVFKLPSLTVSPFQGNLCRLLTHNCFTLYLYFWVLKLTVTSVFFITQIILFLGTFPRSKFMLFLTSKHLTSERILMEMGLYPKCTTKNFCDLA